MASLLGGHANEAESSRVNGKQSICDRLVMLPELTADGELPPGFHITDWDEFESRFGVSSPGVCGFPADCRRSCALQLKAGNSPCLRFGVVLSLPNRPPEILTSF